MDDRPYGGGDGMVFLPEVCEQTLNRVKESKGGCGTVVYLSAQGQQWTDHLARNWAKEHPTTTLICGRYGGIDQRFINKWVDLEISIGDYVLSGGELGALVIMDSVARFQPGVLGNAISYQEDSFSDGLLEGPLFTRPQEWSQQVVPRVLLSGNHQKVEEFRQALRRVVTFIKRRELVKEDLLAKLPSMATFCRQDVGREISSLAELLIQDIKVLKTLEPLELQACGLTSEKLDEIEKNL